MTTNPEPSPDQLALMSELLDGAETDTYIVMPVGALCTQLMLMFEEEHRARREVTTGRLSYLLARRLADLGWTATVPKPPAVTR